MLANARGESSVDLFKNKFQQLSQRCAERSEILREAWRGAIAHVH